MKDIKDIFKDRFENFEESVDPSLWTSIQGALPGAASAGSAGLLSSLGAKIIAACAAVAIVTTAVLVINTNKTSEVIPAVSEKVEEVANPEVAISKSEESKVETTDSNKVENGESSASAQEVKTQSEAPSSAEGVNKETTSTTPKNLTHNKKTENETAQESSTQTTSSSENNEHSIDQQHSTAYTPENFTVIQDPQNPKSVQFIQEETEGVRYLWNFGNGEISDEETISITYADFGVYDVSCIVIDSNGVETEFTQKIEVYLEPVIEIADIFTPNNDGLNARFNLLQQCENVELKFARILNKNNQVVYNYNEGSEGWDGLDLSGEPCPEGTYLYVALFMDQKGDSIKENGKVTLIR